MRSHGITHRVMQRVGRSADGDKNRLPMFGALPQPTHMPCPDCGASVPRGSGGRHVCDKAQRATYELFQLRLEGDRFESELTSWLETPRGRFAVYYAERQRRRAA